MSTETGKNYVLKHKYIPINYDFFILLQSSDVVTYLFKLLDLHNYAMSTNTITDDTFFIDNAYLECELNCSRTTLQKAQKMCEQLGIFTFSRKRNKLAVTYNHDLFLAWGTIAKKMKEDQQRVYNSWYKNARVNQHARIKIDARNTIELKSTINKIKKEVASSVELYKKGVINKVRINTELLENLNKNEETPKPIKKVRTKPRKENKLSIFPVLLEKEQNEINKLLPVAEKLSKTLSKKNETKEITNTVILRNWSEQLYKCTVHINKGRKCTITQMTEFLDWWVNTPNETYYGTIDSVGQFIRKLPKLYLTMQRNKMYNKNSGKQEVDGCEVKTPKKQSTGVYGAKVVSTEDVCLW